MSGSSGLHEVVEKVLSEPSSVDVDSLRVELVDSLDATLLDYRVVRRMPEVVEGYAGLQAEVVETILALTLNRIGALKALQEIIGLRMRGEILESEWCTPVVVKRSMGVRGHVARRGAIICLRDPDEHIFLALAGAVEYITLPRASSVRQVGREQR